MDKLSSAQLLSYLDRNAQSELYGILEKNQIDGFTLQLVDDESISMITGDSLKLKIQLRSLISKLKSGSAIPYNSPHTAMNDTSFDLTPATSRQMPTSTPSPIPQGASFLANEASTEWPKQFFFPTERISDSLREKLASIEYCLDDRDHNEIASILHDKIVNLKITYPSAVQYEMVVRSIFIAYPFLSTVDQLNSILKGKLRRRCQEWRRRNKSNAQIANEIAATQMKYKTATRKKRSAREDHNDSTQEQTSTTAQIQVDTNISWSC